MLDYKKIEDLLFEKENMDKRVSLAKEAILKEIIMLFGCMKKLVPNREIIFADEDWDLYALIDAVIKQIEEWENFKS